MKGTHIKKYCVLDVSSQELLKKAYDSYNMSPRSYYRLIRTARTIADLEGSSDIKLQHLSEALQYRPKAEI